MNIKTKADEKLWLQLYDEMIAKEKQKATKASQDSSEVTIVKHKFQSLDKLQEEGMYQCGILRQQIMAMEKEIQMLKMFLQQKGFGDEDIKEWQKQTKVQGC